MEMITGYVIEIEVLDKRHVGLKSSTMEKKALNHCLQRLQRVLNVIEVCTDPSSSIKKLIGKLELVVQWTLSNVWLCFCPIGYRSQSGSQFNDYPGLLLLFCWNDVKYGDVGLENLYIVVYYSCHFMTSMFVHNVDFLKLTLRWKLQPRFL